MTDTLNDKVDPIIISLHSGLKCHADMVKPFSLLIVYHTFHSFYVINLLNAAQCSSANMLQAWSVSTFSVSNFFSAK